MLPASVGASRRVVRSTSRTPRRFSREMSARVMAGGDRRRRRDAPTKLPASTMATKIPNSSRRSIYYSVLWNYDFLKWHIYYQNCNSKMAADPSWNRGSRHAHRYVHHDAHGRNCSSWDGIVGTRPPSRAVVAHARFAFSVRG